jgi:hypothetical protein
MCLWEGSVPLEGRPGFLVLTELFVTPLSLYWGLTMMKQTER